MKIGILGPAGTWSDLAFSKFFENEKKIFFSDFPEIFLALSEGEVDAIFVPVKTSIREVQSVKKLQGKYNFSVEKTFDFPVEYCLVGRKNSEIKKIFARDEALEMCFYFLEKNFPEAEKISVSSSTFAVEKLQSEENSAAICAAESAGDFEILEKNIAVGVTTFALLKS